jgi:hypothetical protein
MSETSMQTEMDLDPTLEQINAELAKWREAQREWAEKMWLIITRNWFFQDPETNHQVVLVLRRTAWWVVKYDEEPQVLPAVSQNWPAPDSAIMWNTFMQWAY